MLLSILCSISVSHTGHCGIIATSCFTLDAVFASVRQVTFGGEGKTLKPSISWHINSIIDSWYCAIFNFYQLVQQIELFPQTFSLVIATTASFVYPQICVIVHRCSGQNIEFNNIGLLEEDTFLFALINCIINCIKRLVIRSVIGWCVGNCWRRMPRPGSLKNYNCIIGVYI